MRRGRSTAFVLGAAGCWAHWMDRLLFGIRTPSAARIVPELQSLAPGDRVPDSPDGIGGAMLNGIRSRAESHRR